MDGFSIEPVAHIHNDYAEKFGVPRQSGLVPELISAIVFDDEFRNDEALRGIEGYSHLWLIWQFSDSLRGSWCPTVRPPRLGGNTRMGVFATRSPFRPNSLGLSAVKLERIEHTAKFGTVLLVSGADLMNGTPIFDVKPYLPYCDSRPEAVGGFADEFADYALETKCSSELLDIIPPEKRSALLSVLKNDPRPSYQCDPQRVYKMTFGSFTVSFCVNGSCLTVTDISPLDEPEKQ